MNFKNRKDIIRLAENIFFIQSPMNGRFPFCNGFLMTGKETVLIDAGIGKEAIQDIDDEIRIDILVISHSHPDHILRWDMLSDRFIMLPRETPESVNDLNLLGLRFTGTEEGGEYWANRIGRGLGIIPLREPDKRYSDGDLIVSDGMHLEAIHAPGHLNDHYCFFERESGILLTTDIDFTSFGPWYANPESDIAQFKESISRVMALPYQTVCSSHKPPMEQAVAAESFNAYLNAFERQKSDVLECCDPQRTLKDITKESPFYKNRLPDKGIQRIFEEKMILKNLKELIEDGFVVESGGIYRRIK